MARPDVLAPPADSNPQFDPLTNPGQFLTQFEAQGNPVGPWFATLREVTNENFPGVEGIAALDITNYEIPNFGVLLATVAGTGVDVTILRTEITLWGEFEPLVDAPMINAVA